MSTLLLTACGDWLTVSPKTEKPTKDLFTTESGFKDALIGVYIELINDNSYGEAMTMSKVEYLANFWNITANSGEQALAAHNYSDGKAETIIANIYNQHYKVILGVNAILEHIDNNKSIFSKASYETIKGEALAIRALCHLDLLRLWGPVPTEATNTPILSYVEVVTKDLIMPVNFKTYKAKLLSDLQQAYDLLKISSEMQNEVDDDFFKTRTIRMNYLGVKALQARAYLWFGENGKANECAMNVLENRANDRDEAMRFRLGTAEDFAKKDYVLTKEHLFCLYRLDMYTKYMSLFQGHILYKDSKETTVKKDIYGNTGSDIRELNLWELIEVDTKDKFYVSKKYTNYEKVTSTQPDYKYIPIIRLSEIYLIAIETGIGGAISQTLWEEYLVSRNLSVSALPSDLESLQEKMVAEYRKEFYGEGQAFYIYKRFNLASNKFLWAPKAINYVLPLPKTEIIISPEK